MSPHRVVRPAMGRLLSLLVPGLAWCAAAPVVLAQTQFAPAQQGAETPAPAAPGLVEIDPEAAARALERTLISQGALLLPPGRFDLEPYFNFTRRESQLTALESRPGLLTVRSVNTGRNEFDLGLRVRAGLPYDFQAELDLPYRWVNESAAVVGVQERSQRGGSIGDIRVGLAKTLLREQGWQPDLVGRVVWNTGTGDLHDDDLALGQGFQSLRFGLSALKRQDPLAFQAALSYSHSFERQQIQPGAEWNGYLGLSLAASPETSLSLGLSQSFAAETEVRGRKLPGSDQVSSLLALGASSILTRNILLAVNLGVGLTQDAPDYVVNLTLPIRF